MNVPYWLLKLLPMWSYLCPRCRREVKANSHECPHCGEKYPLALKVPPTFLKDPKKLEAYVHKHIFPRVSEFERNYLTKYFTVLFSDGFESGNFIAWTGTTGLPSVQGVVVHHGSFAMASSVFNDICYKTIIAAGTVYARFYVQWTVNPIAGSTKLFLTIENNGIGQGIYAGVQDDGGTVKWRLSVNENDFAYHTYLANAPNPTTGIWYCVEVSWIRNAVGGAKLWIDGVLVLTGGAPRDIDVDKVSVGAGDAFGTIYSDCVVVADAYIGPEISGSSTGTSPMKVIMDNLIL